MGIATGKGPRGPEVGMRCTSIIAAAVFAAAMSLTQGWVSPLDGGAAQLAPGGFYPAYPGVLGASMFKPDKNSLAMAKAARSAGSEAVDAAKSTVKSAIATAEASVLSAGRKKEAMLTAFESARKRMKTFLAGQMGLHKGKLKKAKSKGKKAAKALKVINVKLAKQKSKIDSMGKS